MNISAASYIEKETRRESRQQQDGARQHNRRNEGNNNNNSRRPARDGRSNTRQDGKLCLKCIIVI